MKFNVKRKVIVQEEIDVDDRIFQDHTVAWRIANIILDNRLASFVDDLYDSDDIIINAAKTINEAFQKTDEIIKLKYNHGG